MTMPNTYEVDAFGFVQRWDGMNDGTPFCTLTLACSYCGEVVVEERYDAREPNRGWEDGARHGLICLAHRERCSR